MSQSKKEICCGWTATYRWRILELLIKQKKKWWVLLLLNDNCFKNAITSKMRWKQPGINRAGKTEIKCKLARWAYLMKSHTEYPGTFPNSFSTGCWPSNMNLSIRFNLTTEVTCYEVWRIVISCQNPKKDQTAL